MKFSEYPKEIQLLIQLRVKQRGYEFSEENFNKNPTSGDGYGGFTWHRTPEGNSFWDNVIGKNNFTEFYKKYPKSPYGAQAPIKDRVIGKKFMVTGCHNYDGTPDPEFGKNYNIGTVVTLLRDDGSHCPYFTTEGITQRLCIWWSCLYPLAAEESEESEELKPIGKNTNRFTERPTNVKVGDKFFIVSNIDINGRIRDLSDYNLELELVFELSANDGSDCPYFKGRDSKGDKVTSKVLNWGWLAPLQTSNLEVPQYYTKIPTDVKVGDRFRVIGNKRLSGTIRDFKTLEPYGVKLGSEVVLKILDGSQCPYFNTDCASEITLDWGWLAPITESETKLNIYNNGESNESTEQLILSGIPATIFHGTVGRGEILSSPTAEIKLGR